MKRVSYFLLIVFNLLVTTASAQYNLYRQAGNVDLLNYINSYRASLGLPKVVHDEGLAKAARLQALDNYTKKKFRGRGDDVNKLHQNTRYPKVRDRVKAVGMATAGEFCAEICYAKAGMKNFPLAAAIRPYQSLEQLMFTRYKFSPSHRAIIATRAYTRVGIHTIYDGHYVYNAVVFMTGKPKKTSRRRAG
jgi:uncharacterized protein YkwD